MTGRGLLLDTCAVIWVFGGAVLEQPVRDAIADAAADGRLHLSPISGWEVGMLVSKNRIALSLAPARWVEAAFTHPGVRVLGLEPSLLVESSFLPDKPPDDPADRIIIATARAHGLLIVTRDRAIIDYATRGHVAALPC